MIRAVGYKDRNALFISRRQRRREEVWEEKSHPCKYLGFEIFIGSSSIDSSSR